MIKQSFCKLLIALFPLSVFAQVEQPPTLSLTETESEINSASLPASEATEKVSLGEPIQEFSISVLPSELAETPPLLVRPTKSPTVAVLLSSLAPGLGHYYLGEVRVGSELLGSSLLGGVSAYATRNDPSLFATSVYTMQAISLYGIFAAYRDARLYNGNPPLVLPRDDFKNLSTAPFQWSVMKKPEVWGALLGAVTVAVTVSYLTYSEEIHAKVKTTYIEPLSALPVAVGEESFFRGFMQTVLTEKLPPWSAITLSSLAFGAAHIPNAMQFNPSQRWRYYAFSLPIITSFGAYMGWLTYKNRSLKESVALHAWYDFVLMSAGALASKAAIGGKTHISHSWEF